MRAVTIWLSYTPTKHAESDKRPGRPKRPSREIARQARRLLPSSRAATAAFYAPQETMIVTIDGPAGTGKSSTARSLAARLGVRFLDTGAMYRAVTLAAILRGVNLKDARAMERLVRAIEMDLSGDRVLLDGADVTEAIRTTAVTDQTRHAADNPGVRNRLVELQRAFAKETGVVTEGRDQGTVVFPDADYKFFLTASESVRARRRCDDLAARGESIPLDSVLDEQRRRDLRDIERKVGALRKADDAIEVNTDGLSLDEVVERLFGLIRDA